MMGGGLWVYPVLSFGCCIFSCIILPSLSLFLSTPSAATFSTVF